MIMKQVVEQDAAPEIDPTNGASFTPKLTTVVAWAEWVEWAA